MENTYALHDKKMNKTKCVFADMRYQIVGEKFNDKMIIFSVKIPKFTTDSFSFESNEISFALI